MLRKAAGVGGAPDADADADAPPPSGAPAGGDSPHAVEEAHTSFDGSGCAAVWPEAWRSGALTASARALAAGSPRSGRH